jgi:hypothetical protein
MYGLIARFSCIMFRRVPFTGLPAGLDSPAKPKALGVGFVLSDAHLFGFALPICIVVFDLLSTQVSAHGECRILIGRTPHLFMDCPAFAQRGARLHRNGSGRGKGLGKHRAAIL